jgi:protein-S-isoprenylcysteine O-methyltransferase Ste14
MSVDAAPRGTIVPPRPAAADWIASALLFAMLVVRFVHGRGANAGLRAAADPFFLAGIILAILPMFQLSRLGRPEEGKSCFYTTQVVDRGLFSVVRHPQYLGYCLWAAGFALYIQHWTTSAMAIGAAVFLNVQAAQEERFLTARLGGEYVEYARRVPRFNLPLGILRWLAVRRGERVS